MVWKAQVLPIGYVGRVEWYGRHAYGRVEWPPVMETVT